MVVRDAKVGDKFIIQDIKFASNDEDILAGRPLFIKIKPYYLEGIGIAWALRVDNAQPCPDLTEDTEIIKIKT